MGPRDGRRAGRGVPSFRGGVVGGVMSKPRLKLSRRVLVVKLLRQKSGRRLKKRASVGGPTVVTIKSPVPVRDTRDTSDTDEDGDDDDDSKSVSSNSSDVVIVDETPAQPPSAIRGASKQSGDLVKLAAKALDLNVRSEHGMGNCMFCAFSSGVNSWLLAKGTAGKGADRALFRDAVEGDGEKSSGQTITWSHLRSALVCGLRVLVRDAPKLCMMGSSKDISKKKQKKLTKQAREIQMSTLMEGKEGRAWLSKGELANVSIPTRFEKYVESMSKDASPFAGHKTWRNYWGADNELVVLAAQLNLAVVCVETATQTQGFFLAVPSEIAEMGEGNKNIKYETLHRPGRYMSGGALENFEVSDRKGTQGKQSQVLRWRAARGKLLLTVRLVRADGKKAKAAVGGSSQEKLKKKITVVLPALIVVHRPGHFDSLQPNEGWVLFMERTEVGGVEV